MTFREKIKSILHHDHKRKSLPPSTAASDSKPSPTTPTATYKPDPNKPPNARDPGFRKDFNLSSPNVKSEPQSINGTGSQYLSSNGDSSGKQHMYTVDKYGDDYLAVSPRTNVTVPDGVLNRGASPVDEGAKTGLGIIEEQKVKDPVVGAAKALDGMPAQMEPGFAEEGDRKDSGFVEPAPTPSKPESLPPKTQDPPSISSKITSLLSPPLSNVEDGASSVYSDDSSRPPLQQVASSEYSQLVQSPNLSALPSPGPQTTTATEHQRKYSLLVAGELPAGSQPNPIPETEEEEKEPLPVIDENTDLSTAVRRSFGESSAMGAVSPLLPATSDDGVQNNWSDGVIADFGKIHVVTPRPLGERELANGYLDGVGEKSNDTPAGLGEDAQAAAFADIVSAHVQGLQPSPNNTLSEDAQAAAFAEIVSTHIDSLKPSPETNTLLPASQKPIVTTTNTVPHASAEDMGDMIPDVPEVEGKGPIVTTTNTVPHANKDVVPEEATKVGFDRRIWENREKPVRMGLERNEDSVYEITKVIPGAF